MSDYYTYVEPGPDDKPVYTTLSKKEILKEYWPYWSKKMIEKYGEDSFHKTWTASDCIDDWVTTHWAWGSNDEQS